MTRFLRFFRRGFAENVRFAFDAIREHTLRSSLTVVGVVVGVATVIAMVAIVSGFNNNVIRNLQAFGANTVTFQKYEDRFGSGGPASDEEKRRPNLTEGDVLAVREACPRARAVSVEAGVFDEVLHVRNGALEANQPYVLGVDEFYPIASAYNVAHGRSFTPSEVRHSALVALLGADTREAIFPREDPVGRTVAVNGMPYRVIGVLERKGEQFGFSPDNKVVLTFGAFARQFGLDLRRDGVRINCVPRGAEQLPDLIECARGALRLRRKVAFDKPDNFAFTTPDQLIGQFRSITGGITGAMVFIALISLLIGGVGIMNIMLVSVTQRTREIGIRKAVGALRRDIVRQFLTEAVTLSTIGGSIGVGLGILISLGVRRAFPSLPTTVPAWSVVLGLAVSMGVGIFFGAYPAVQAARLDPIESLRHE
jgi:putative ABC transport system permease protein